MKLLLALTLLTGLFKAEDASRLQPVERPPNPVWAIEAALADAGTLDHVTASTTRYIWNRDGDRETLAVLAYVVNEVLNRTNSPVSPQLEPGGAIVVGHGGRLVRVNLALLAGDPAELQNLLNTWDRMVNSEPDFTADIPNIEKFIAEVPRFRHTDGKFYTRQWQSRHVTVRATSPFVLAQGALLQQKVGSACGIIDSREFIKLATTTLEGGLYYEFRGIGADLKFSDYLRRVGVKEEHAAAFDPPGKAFSSETVDKAAVIRSKVTGKPRGIALIPTTGTRLTAGISMVTVTFDIFNENHDPAADPIRNLVTMVPDGFEVIATTATGREYTIWDKQGRLQRSAPDRLVSDHEVPAPHTTMLQPGMSCIRCHGPEDGWKGFANVIPMIQATGINAIIDQSGADPITLRGMYEGDWFGILGPMTQSRAQYADLVLKSTGWIPTQDNSSSAIEVAGLYSRIYGRYVYDELDAMALCREIGLAAKTPEEAVAALASISQQPQPGVLAQEEPVLRALMAGFTIDRRSLRTIKGNLYHRVYIEQQQKGLKP